MNKVTLWAFGLAAVLVLAAGCSSGGNDVARIPPGDDLGSKLESYSAGQPTLDMTADEVEDALRAFNTKLTHDLYSGSEAVACEPECGFDIDALRAVIIAGELKTVPVLEHNGVRVAKLESSGFVLKVDDWDEFGNVIGEFIQTFHDYAVYGGWLDYSAFSVNGAVGCLGQNCLLTRSLGVGWVQMRVARPPKPTRWELVPLHGTGLMIGMLQGDEDYLVANGRVDDTLYAGDARITIDDLANPDVDVSFTGIYTDKGDSVAAMSWKDLPVSNGLFGAGRFPNEPMPPEPTETDEYIAGMFTGPSHQEVVGSFNRDGIIGAFGAKR